MFRRNKGENKAKLEHKLYLARETPEPIFDLSECNIKHVPQGIYSLCKVFLKEELRLENNCLSSLTGGGNLSDLHFLRILDIHNNAFTSLPDDICLLVNLQELYVDNNQLKKLPDTICKLAKLKILNVSGNNLKCLPEGIGNLKNLLKFFITNNKNLTKLPKSVCRAHRLLCLELDGEHFIYPPPDVTMKGTEAIMKFICEDTGSEYIQPGDLEETDSALVHHTNDMVDDGFSAKIWELENIKQQKLQEFLEIEKQNEFFHQQEFQMANTQKLNREKLLADLTQEQNKFDIQLTKLQREKELDRFRLVEQLHEEEQNADIAIKQLLSLSQEPLAQLLEQEKLEEQKLIAATAKYNEDLRKDDILNTMRDMLEQETLRFQQFDQSRFDTNKTLLEHELESDHKLAQILLDQDYHKAELISLLQEDGELQKAAVGTLLERGDARSWGLVQQVKIVEAQLGALTHIELDRRKLEIDHQVNDLAEKRMNLSALLMDLLDKQKERRLELLDTLERMESSNSSAEDFWLKQYQTLLDRLPMGLAEAQKNIDPTLAQALLTNGVLHCLPFLAKLTQCQCDIKDITEIDLQESGITNRLDRLHIMDAFRMYGKEQDLYRPLSAPSTSKVPIEEASAPPTEYINTSAANECVVCLDLECEIIFVPCGHLACCTNCSESIMECPLCRGDIERKIHIVP